MSKIEVKITGEEDLLTADLTAMTTDDYKWQDCSTEYPWRENPRIVYICKHEHGVYKELHDEETEQEVEERVKVSGVEFFRYHGRSWQRAICPEYAPPVTEAQKRALDLISKIHHSNQ